MGDVAVEVALGPGAVHPEGPMWDGPTGRLWWVDIEGRRVHRFDPVSGEDEAFPVAGPPGGVVLDTAGVPVVATPEGLATLDPTSGRTTLRVPIEAGRPGSRANDVKVDGRGRLWMGTMACDQARGQGALYRVDGGVVTRVVGGLTVSNGPALDERGGRLYLADSPLGIVDRFTLDPASGEIHDRRRFLDFSDRGLLPDGMTIDDEGMLWVALGNAGEVHRYAPDGTLVQVVGVPTSNPTSVAFGGPDGGDLYITSSWADVDPVDRATQPLAGAIFHCRPGVTGRPMPRCRLAHEPRPVVVG